MPASFERFVADRLMASNSASFTKSIIRIAIASLAISMAIMIITNATITGFKYEIKNKIFGFWGHIQINDVNITQNFNDKAIDMADVPVDSIAQLDQVTYSAFSLDENTAETRRSTAGVASVNSMALIPGVIDTKTYFDPILLKGLGLDYDWSIIEPFIIEGRAIELTNDSKPSDDILISEQTAKKLQLSVGQRFIIGFLKDKNLIKRRFTVSGIYRTGLEEYDRRFAIIDILEIQTIMGWSATEVSGLEIRLDELQDMDVFQDYINVELLPANLEALSIRNVYPAIFDWLELQDINEDITVLLVLLVALVNMITTLLILIIDRTRMIGVLKALGANDFSLRKIFLYYAGRIIFWGLIIGNALGWGLALIQKLFGIIKLDEASYYLSVAPIRFDLPFILFLNVGSALIILIVLLIPSYLVSKIDPVKAIGFQ